MRFDKFCHWHIEAAENEGDTEKHLACTAHLAEGRCFNCPYMRGEIYEQDGRMRIAHRDEQCELVGVCEDFRFSEE